MEESCCGEALIPLASDYMAGALPAVMERLARTNLEATPGYGTDSYCESARAKIRAACACPDAAVHFLVGGTQTNATVIDALLRPYQGVLAADTGHIAGHEAGAVEASGHKVLILQGTRGKIAAEQVDAWLEAFYADGNNAHAVQPGMVYISQPTEYGTLYSLEELTALSAVCRRRGLPLYADGARLAYALASSANDVSLADLARLCDVFYIGGTKCGALFGEAVVVPDSARLPCFFTTIKQHGALLAKGRLLGLQFDELFSGDLYVSGGRTGVQAADRIRSFLAEKGFEQLLVNGTNQVFLVLEDSRCQELFRKVACSFWERKDAAHSVVRLVTSWASSAQDIDRLLAVLDSLR
ncbi:MAG: low specificity L-threonine aldolase [Treponema sp.]|nr:low specificity L-threonine aldolase [Treponema sp.]